MGGNLGIDAYVKMKDNPVHDSHRSGLHNCLPELANIKAGVMFQL